MPMAKARQSFSQILDNVIIKAYNEHQPIASSSKEILIGDLSIIVDDGVCNIMDKDTKVIKYAALYLIEAAFLIAKYTQLDDTKAVREIIKLEKSYAKYHDDMKYYHRSCTNAIAVEDFAKLDTYQIRYKDARSFANLYKDRLRLKCNAILKK